MEIADQLKKLAELRDAGVLDDSEFEAAKARALRDNSATGSAEVVSPKQVSEESPGGSPTAPLTDSPVEDDPTRRLIIGALALVAFVAAGVVAAVLLSGDDEPQRPIRAQQATTTTTLSDIDRCFQQEMEFFVLAEEHHNRTGDGLGYIIRRYGTTDPRTQQLTQIFVHISGDELQYGTDGAANRLLERIYQYCENQNSPAPAAQQTTTAPPPTPTSTTSTTQPEPVAEDPHAENGSHYWVQDDGTITGGFVFPSGTLGEFLELAAPGLSEVVFGPGMDMDPRHECDRPDDTELDHGVVVTCEVAGLDIVAVEIERSMTQGYVFWRILDWVAVEGTP